MVREAIMTDLQAILELYTHLHEKEIPEMTENLESTWQAIMRDENHHLIVNEVDGVIAASCVCVIVPNLTRGIRPYAIIENVVTHEAYRCKGYATECLRYAKKIATKANCYKMMLMTGTKSQQTIDFYKNNGYNNTDKMAFVQWLEER